MNEAQPYTPKQFETLADELANTGELDELRKLAASRETISFDRGEKFLNVRRISALLDRLFATAERGVELEQSFDLYYSAIIRGQKLWRDAEPGRELIAPDTGELVAWLLDLVGKAGRADELGRLRISLDGVSRDYARCQELFEALGRDTGIEARTGEELVAQVVNLIASRQSLGTSESEAARDALLTALQDQIGEDRAGDGSRRLSVRQCRIIGIPDGYAGISFRGATGVGATPAGTSKESEAVTDEEANRAYMLLVKRRMENEGVVSVRMLGDLLRDFVSRRTSAGRPSEVAAEPRDPEINDFYLTQAEFDALLEYSTSLPTGTTIGKQWKRREEGRTRCDTCKGGGREGHGEACGTCRGRGWVPDGKVRWFIGEYSAHDGDNVLITWYRAQIRPAAPSHGGGA